MVGARRVIEQMMTAFAQADVGRWAVWDAIGRNRAAGSELYDLICT